MKRYEQKPSKTVSARKQFSVGDAKADAVINYAQKVRDWPTLEAAIEAGKIAVHAVEVPREVAGRPQKNSSRGVTNFSPYQKTLAKVPREAGKQPSETSSHDGTRSSPRSHRLDDIGFGRSVLSPVRAHPFRRCVDTRNRETGTQGAGNRETIGKIQDERLTWAVLRPPAPGRTPGHRRAVLVVEHRDLIGLDLDLPFDQAGRQLHFELGGEALHMLDELGLGTGIRE